MNRRTNELLHTGPAFSSAAESGKTSIALSCATLGRDTWELVVCTAAIVASQAGQGAAGTVLLRSDPRVLAAPECFEPVLG
jgi:hypothetical protein